MPIPTHVPAPTRVPTPICFLFDEPAVQRNLTLHLDCYDHEFGFLGGKSGFGDNLPTLMPQASSVPSGEAPSPIAQHVDKGSRVVCLVVVVLFVLYVFGYHYLLRYQLGIGAN